MVKTRRSNNGKISRHGYYSEESPQFFKIFLPPGCFRRIKIPSAFIKKYLNGVSPSTSILRVTNYASKRLWHIGINKVEKHFFFENGWPQFVRDNSLEKGEFLIFSYSENSKYDVTIFGLNGCPKIFSIGSTTDKEDELPRNQDIVEPHNDGATETRTNLSSKKPTFERVMKSSYLLTGQLYIPIHFVRSYITANDTTAKLKHLDKSWVVNLKSRKVSNCHRVLLCSGWKQFAEDNNIKEGDICRFELIQRDDYVFNVVISRGNRTSKTSQGSD